MKYLFFLLLTGLAGFGGRAQTLEQPAAIDLSKINDTLTITGSTWLYVDSSASLPPKEVMGRRFLPLKDFRYRRDIPPAMITFSYYTRFRLFNNTDTIHTVYLFPGALFHQIKIYKIKNEPELVLNADLVPGYGKINLAPGERAELLVYLKPVKNETVFLTPRLIAPRFLEPFKLILEGSRSTIKIFGYIISGVLLMMIIFMGTNFMFSNKWAFFYNTLYSICMFLLVFFNSYLAKTNTPFTNFFISYFDFFLLVTGTMFYISFTRNFLNTSLHYQFLDRILKYGKVFIILLLIVYTGINFLTGWFVIQVFLENLMKFVILLIGIFFIILALKQRTPLLNYLAAGNASLVIFSSISLGVIWNNTDNRSLFSSSLFYYYIGIVLELFFFLLGLSYKNRSELIERTKEQEAMKLVAEKKEYETQIAMIKMQQEERNRISADMHDDLGAGMTTIRLYSELAKNKLVNNPIPEIDKISSSANELLNKMNAIIWSMSSSNDSLGNMTAYIRSYALEFFENTGITCRITMPENLPNIEVIGEIRRNVFLVVKEALNNILKHSKATEVNITLQRVEHGLTLFIQDNGIGIKFEELRQFSNGLNNMKKRMGDVGIAFSIQNNNGTLITLHRRVENPFFF